MQQYLIPAIAAIIVATIEAFAAKDRQKNKKEQKRVDARAQRRAEESQLSMRMMNATLDLGLATAAALENISSNHPDKDLAHVKEIATAAQSDYKNFVEKVAAEQLAKK